MQSLISLKKDKKTHSFSEIKNNLNDLLFSI